MGSNTDAFARHTARPSGSETGAHQDWMGDWTVFFFGWWVAWCPFVGMFLATISKGRTIREFINGTMFTPMFYTFLWYNVYGSAGIKMERFAESIDLNGWESPAYVTLGTGKNTSCNVNDKDCVFVSRLSERGHSEMWLDTLAQFYGLGYIVMPISFVAVALYFITSSDSGSLIADSLASNGLQNSPLPQKMYWAITQGACSTALLYAGSAKNGGERGGKEFMEALEAAAVSSGVPFSILMCFMCPALWKACQKEYLQQTWPDRHFATDLTKILDFSTSRSWLRTLQRTFVAIFAPWYFLRTAVFHSKGSRNRKRTYLGVMSLLFYLWVVFLCLQGVVAGFLIIGWWWYFCFVGMLMNLRYELRTERMIDGNVFEDLFACLLAYYLVADQLDEHFRLDFNDNDIDESRTELESDEKCKIALTSESNDSGIEQSTTSNQDEAGFSDVSERTDTWDHHSVADEIDEV